MDDRVYLAEEQHPDNHLPPLSVAWLLCMNSVFTKVTLIIVNTFLPAFFIRAIYNMCFDYCEAYLSFDDYSTIR